MAEVVKIKFKKGWVDNNGGAWLPNMVASVPAETAKKLIAEDTAEAVKAETKPAVNLPKE